MTDQLITFETAKLAKEKGFDIVGESKFNYFLEDGGMWNNNFGYDKESSAYAPTQSLLQKWLREKHSIIVTTFLKNKDLGNFWGGAVYNIKVNTIPKSYGSNFNTYEEALEKGLQEALKLIE